MSQRPLRIGHRGAAGHAPENTLVSVETALSLGVDVVEIDVHVSRDGHLAVIHDDRVDRTTEGYGYIRELTLAELQALKIPTVAQVIDMVKGRAALMLDIKVRNIARALVELTALTPALPVFYASFFHSELLRVRELDPAARTIALLDAVPVSLTAFASDARASHAGIGFDSLEPGFVASLKDAGLGVFVFTVDHPRDIAHARSLGVDGLISNFPDRLN
jgi:glycerophosphoryl diester phosphodiesterase